jgi:signal transduction histidine kinase
MTWSLVAAAAAIAVVAIAFVLRLADAIRLGTISADAMVPTLVAIAFLCLAGLARRSAPAAFGFSLGVGALLGAIEAIAVIRGWLPATPVADRAFLVAIAGVTGTAATLVAWRFAMAQLGDDGVTPRRDLVFVLAVGVVGLFFAFAVATAATDPIALRADEVTPLRIATRIMLALSSAALVVGAALVVLPRLARSRRQATAPGGVGWGGALLDQFLPALAPRRVTAESERARLAADLHALVVPELRNAMVATSRADPAVAARVRSALDEVEQLMTTRHSPVLESFGLVAAFEWLAERTQERAGVTVGLEIDPATTDTRPSRAVERAAFRVALLAVDNAVRHAQGAAIHLGVRVERKRVSLQIDDDGPGLSAAPHGSPGPTAGEHRGLMDLRAEAEAVGASVEVGPRPGQPGTRVAFDWTA